MLTDTREYHQCRACFGNLKATIRYLANHKLLLSPSIAVALITKTAKKRGEKRATKWLSSSPLLFCIASWAEKNVALKAATSTCLWCRK